MKRHESLVALSRDHHFGLLFCWKLRQGLKKGVALERMQPYVSYFWQHHLQQHFEEEEKLLFTLLHDHLTEQAMTEHKYIRQLAEAVIHASDIQSHQVEKLADTLDDHIRFEERKLFPHLEEQLPEKQLAELHLQLQQLHPTQEKDDYADEFWI